MDYGEEIGAGTYGVVYLWRDGNDAVIVKRPQTRGRYEEFREELLILKKFAHPNIVKYRDRPVNYKVASEDLLIFMEYCEHHSLRNVIKSPQYIYHLKNILQWLNHIFCGLEYLYMQKTVHGDLKPENIFVDKDFVLKLGDFGSLKQLDDSADLHEALQVGTLGYMAPEYSCMVVSELTAEERYKADVYSSGIVLMEIDNRRNHIPNADVVFDFGVPDYLQEILTLCTASLDQRANCGDVLQKVQSRLSQTPCDPPEICRKQAWLVKPVGLDGSNLKLPIPREMPADETPNSWALNSRFSEAGPPEANEAGEQRYAPFDDLVEKAKATTSFHSRVIRHRYLPAALKNLREIYEFSKEWLRERDVNQIRASLAKVATEYLERVTDKKDFVEKISEYRGFLEHNPLGDLLEWRELRSGPINSRTSTAHVNFLASFAQDKWPNLGGDEATGRAANSLMPLVRLDYFIQLHCMISALEAIALCKETRYRLASLDLYKLTTIALTNVEQLDGIFTKRLKLPILLYKQPQDQWYEVVPMKMVFRTDLSAAQPKWPDDHEVRKAQDAPLDIETIRRALIVEMTALCHPNPFQGQAYPRMQLDRFFWEFRDRLELKLTTEDTQKCKVHNVEEVLQKHREACGEDLMKRYLFFLDEPPMFPCSHEADCPRAGYPTDVPKELQHQYHPCSNSEHLNFLKAHSAMNRAIRYFSMLDYPSSCNRPLIFLLDDLLREVSDAELDDIAFNCLTATTTREHRYAVSQEFIPPEPNSDVPSRRSGIVNHVKKVKNRPCDVLPGYLIQAPTKNDTVLWGLRLGRAPVRAGLDLDLTGVAQLKFSDIRPILETLKDELKDWDDRLLMDERRLGSDFILGNEWRAIRQQEYERRMEEFLEKLEKLASFSAEKPTLRERLKNWWNSR